MLYELIRIQKVLISLLFLIYQVPYLIDSSKVIGFIFSKNINLLIRKIIELINQNHTIPYYIILDLMNYYI